MTKHILRTSYDLNLLNRLHIPVWIVALKPIDIWWANSAALTLWNISQPDEIDKGVKKAFLSNVRSWRSQLEQENNNSHFCQITITNERAKLECICSILHWQSEELILVEAITVRSLPKLSPIELLLSQQDRIFAQIAFNLPLTTILETAIANSEAQFPQRRADILLFNKEQTSKSTARLFSSSINTENYSCLQTETIVADLATELAFPHRHALLSLGFRSYWAVPICSLKGERLGTFVLYGSQPSTPSPQEYQLMEITARSLGIAIAYYRSELARKQLEKQYCHACDRISQGMFQLGLKGRYLKVNSALAKIYGYQSPQQLIASLTNWEKLYVNPQRCREIELSLTERGFISGLESQIYRRDGSKIWIVEERRTVYDENNNLIGYEGTVEDITDRRFAAETLVYAAFSDRLTGLPNRTWMTNRLKSLIELSLRRADFQYAILLIDLDDIKIINDSLGHVVGDEVLKQAASRLKSILRKSDTVTRFGGDEFAVILENITDIDEVTNVAERIKEQLRLSFQVKNHKIFTGASIGITFSSNGYRQPEELLRDADLAMYQAKLLGKNRYEIFTQKMQIAARQRMELDRELRQAIAKEQFSLHYQPLVSLKNGNLRGFEALIRWYHPSWGMVSPIDFIPLAETTGLIEAIGKWVIQKACWQLKDWQEQFGSAADLTMNINVAIPQLKQKDLVAYIKQILQQTKLEGGAIELEITESCFLETLASEASTMKQLKALGLELCIDDFGTGYSSLSRLHSFPVDTLKIDRSFISRLETNSSQAAIVETIVTLARSLGMNSVSEGIETTAQLVKLQELGCDLGQGYLFSSPLDAAKASAFIANWQQFRQQWWQH